MHDISDNELQQHAASIGVELGDQGEAFRRAANDLVALVSQAEALLSPSAERLAAPRWAGRPPTKDEDPLNAIVRWCEVPPTGEGVLSGRRITVKDSVFVGGVPTTCGYRALHHFRPERDAVVVQRILAAGGTIVGMTNMDMLGFAAGGESSGYGPTLNPADAGRTSGGSSSGAAAALSYPGIDIGIGTDQGGSVRVPASWCGYLGIKPTHGLVPYTGAAGIDQVIDHVGPLARTTSDLAAALTAIAGPHESDPRQRQDREPVDYVEAIQRGEGLTSLRVGVLDEGFAIAKQYDDGTPEQVEASVERLASLGASIRRVSVPEHNRIGPPGFVCNLEGIASLLRSGGFGYGSLTAYDPSFSAVLSNALRSHANDLSPQVKLAWSVGSILNIRYGGALYGASHNSLAGYRKAYERMFADVDVLVMPTTPFVAYEPYSGADLDEFISRGWSMLANTAQFNATGLPAISLPTGMVGTLPVGTMLVAPLHQEALLLQIARSYEDAYGWTSPEQISSAGFRGDS